jgi:hypothetical protein
LIFLLLSVFPASAQTFSWSALGLGDGDTIASGSTITDSPGGSVTMTVTTIRTTDGGVTFTTYGDSEFSYDTSGSFGGLNDYFEVGFDSNLCDQDDTFEILLSFSSPVNNLQFTIADVDQASWDDIIEIEVNGTNVRPVFGDDLLILGADVAEDDETFANGYEGTTSVPSGSTTGNIDFDSTSMPSFAFNNVRIIYFSGDDGSNCGGGGNPGSQRIGIGDITFSGTTVPVTLGFFNSTVSPAGVELEWETVQEVGHAGFQVYGKQESQWILLTPDLIQPQGGNSLAKSVYHHNLGSIDESIEWLSLVDVSLSEEVVPHGPYQLAEYYGSRVVEEPDYDWGNVIIIEPSDAAKRSMVDRRLRLLLQDDELMERARGKK